MNIYWGDIHNHCNITYGFGSIENAIDAAKEQLDFCAITGHAMWPDIPIKTKKVEYLVDFHKAGFKKLSDNWDSIRARLNKNNKENKFLTFQSYEIHSSKHGDHHILSKDSKLELINAKSPSDLVMKLKKYDAISVPHHIAYTPGYRGINWDTFNENNSPVVEVFSKHGCGVSENSIYPFLHTMGPRDSRSSVYEGLKRKKVFGFVASTDHHAGYPGSYGDGRVGVLANELTRDAIFDAIKNRRTFAITGDKISCDFKINDNPMGSIIKKNKQQRISLNIVACDFIDKIIIYKNTKPWKIINGEEINNKEESNKYKIRIETGWGRIKEPFKWDCNVKINKGELLNVEKCFRGMSILAPSKDMISNPDINKIENKLLSKDKTSVHWINSTCKNPSTLHPQTNAMILEVQGNENTMIKTIINKKENIFSIGELLENNFSEHMDSYNSNAYLIHSAVPESKYSFAGNWIDTESEDDCDIYHVEIRQMNNQMAWISPIYVYK